MTRRTVCLIIVFTSLFLCSCGRYSSIGLEQAEDAFQTYRNQLEIVLEEYGYSLSDSTDAHTSNRVRDWTVSVSDDEEIYIHFILEGVNGENDKGIIYFSVTNHMNTNNGPTSPNTPLFLSLIQAVSEKPLAEDTLAKFLLAPEEEYPASAYNLYGSEDTLLYKIQYLDYWNTWILSQEQTTTYEEIAYGGIAKSIDQ